MNLKRLLSIVVFQNLIFFKVSNAEPVAFSSVLINLQNRDTYVLPADATTPANDSQQLEPTFIFQPAKWNPLLRNPENFLGLNTTGLAERLQIFTESFSDRMKDIMQVKLNAEFGSKVAQFMRQNQDKAVVWPLKTIMSASELISEQGVLAVFVFRNSEKSGILEALDFSYFNKGTLTRHYWSRQMYDPQLRESASKTLSKVTAAFKKQIKTSPLSTQGNIRFVFEKSVSDVDFAAVESLLKEKGQSSVFSAYEINKNDIRYQSTLAKGTLETVVAKLKKSVLKIDVRAIPGEEPLIQISNKTLQ